MGGNLDDVCILEKLPPKPATLADVRSAVCFRWLMAPVPADGVSLDGERGIMLPISMASTVFFRPAGTVIIPALPRFRMDLFREHSGEEANFLRMVVGMVVGCRFPKNGTRYQKGFRRL